MIKKFWLPLFIAGVVIGIIAAIYDKVVNVEEITMKGIVKSHDITFDKYGSDVVFRTLVLCNDGTVEEVIGKSAYIIPVDSNIYFKARRRKK